MLGTEMLGVGDVALVATALWKVAWSGTILRLGNPTSLLKWP
jgi:hypothetical protein